MAEILTTYFHYIGFMVLYAALVTEHLWTKKKVHGKTAIRLALIDAIYGLSAGVVLVTGILKLIYYGKPMIYYTNNWIFFTKIGFFISVGLLSIWPTIVILKMRKQALENEDIYISYPKTIKNIFRAELILVSLIPLLAALMARGQGQF